MPCLACQPPAYLYLRFARYRCAPLGLDRLRLGIASESTEKHSSIATKPPLSKGGLEGLSICFYLVLGSFSLSVLAFRPLRRRDKNEMQFRGTSSLDARNCISPWLLPLANERLKPAQPPLGGGVAVLIVLFGRFFWQCARLALSLQRQVRLVAADLGSGEESPGNTEHHAG